MKEELTKILKTLSYDELLELKGDINSKLKIKDRINPSSTIMSESIYYAEIGATPKVKRNLIENKIYFVRQLVKRTERELKTMNGVGAKAVVDMEHKLSEYNIRLGMTEKEIDNYEIKEIESNRKRTTKNKSYTYEK